MWGGGFSNYFFLKIPRFESISREYFTESFLQANRPVIVTQAMDDWLASRLWTPSYFVSQFKEEWVQLYDSLFTLINVATIGDYIQTYFGSTTRRQESLPYVRAYAKFKSMDFIWADALFDKLQTHWQLPDFLPLDNYLLPNVPKGVEFKPHLHTCPAKGVFISAQGCETKLHQDPWCSDAVLCQLYGEKQIYLIDPIKARKFQGINSALERLEHITYLDTLKPGEILFIPQGWLHHVITTSDSISLTWNFVHQSNCTYYQKWLKTEMTPSDQAVIAFFS